ncbi:hypothetical protein Q1W73_03835 [Asticcacaulis sp. ZE23SCel15]|uniref:hypothetical protein n=1 Tax=Asticcacaulis sp. ZE23SCel15 TaxID=3059027 RepID=UPI00265F583C|nr:hypothetical protein [Asticcacaulis sp. ZE23SCel15]WKL58121.1 hypothetical protein Q1W73_03835 [Asticcacaulis sp. ZE23SCel15]
MIKLNAVLVAAAFGVLTASAAFAECDIMQGQQVGKAITRATQKDLSGVITPARKPVIDILKCEGGGSKFEATFRYSQIDADGQIVWIEGIAKGQHDAVTNIEYRKSSPQLQSRIEPRKGRF